MKKERGSLGRGLASILGEGNHHITKESALANTTTSPSIIANISEISISEIVTNPFQPRTVFDNEKLNELALSIEQLGIIQPITVRKMQEKKFQLISGERRLKAAKIVGLDKIPAFIRIANDQEMLEMALVENIQRQTLNPIEIALSYERLIQEINLTQEECSERVGKKRSTITNFLRLLKLPEIIQKGLIDGSITNGHARSLLRIQSKESQINLYYDIVSNGYSVREVEELAKIFSNIKYKRSAKKQNIVKPLPFSQQNMIYSLEKNLDCSVQLKRNKNGKGKIIIPFNNDTDLERIIKILKN